MNGMILSTYVLKAQQQAESRRTPATLPDGRTEFGGLRTIAPLLASLGSVAMFAAVLDALK